jgi:hypothetical protein
MFYVDVSGELRERIKACYREAVKQNRQQHFLAALTEINRRLTEDPKEFGDPLYRLPLLKLQIRSAAIRPVFVEYGVSEENPLVVLRRIKLM